MVAEPPAHVPRPLDRRGQPVPTHGSDTPEPVSPCDRCVAFERVRAPRTHRRRRRSGRSSRRPTHLRGRARASSRSSPPRDQRCAYIRRFVRRSSRSASTDTSRGVSTRPQIVRRGAFGATAPILTVVTSKSPSNVSNTSFELVRIQRLSVPLEITPGSNPSSGGCAARARGSRPARADGQAAHGHTRIPGRREILVVHPTAIRCTR